jgi:hypothetical protein
VAALLAMLDAQSASGLIAPPRAEIAARSHQSLRSVDYAKSELRGLGHVDWDMRYDDGAYSLDEEAVHYRWQDTNGYTVPPDGVRNICAPSPPAAKNLRKKELVSNNSVDNSPEVPNDADVFVDREPVDWRVVARLQNGAIAYRAKNRVRKSIRLLPGSIATRLANARPGDDPTYSDDPDPWPEPPY